MTSTSRRHCAVFGCRMSGSLHSLPKDQYIRKKWLKFLSVDISEDYSPHLLVCSGHFTADCFQNLVKYNAGFTKKLLLNEAAVPTLQNSTWEEQLDNTLQVVRHSHVATQTVSPRSRSIGIQVSAHTFPSHRKSQATLHPVTSSTTETLTTDPDTECELGVKPMKIPRLEMAEVEVELEEEEEEEEEEEDEELENEEDPKVLEAEDPTYVPYESEEPDELSENGKEESSSAFSCDYTDPKYIVFESCLLQLFHSCPVCRRDCEVQRRRMATFVSFSQHCPYCQYSRKWESQPVKGSHPVGNLQLSAAVYFIGASFSQVAKLLRAMNIQMLKYSCYRKHARMFLEATVNHKWRMDQRELIQSLRQQDRVAVAGCMRTDLLTYSGVVGSYSLMHLKSNNIIDIELDQILKDGGERGGSDVQTELLRRSLDFLRKNQVSVDYMVTDRQKQLQKYLREHTVIHDNNAQHMDKDRLVCDVGRLSNDKISAFDNFLRVTRRFAPKKVTFPFIGVLCRLYLAAMQFNENAQKQRGVTSEEETEIDSMDSEIKYVSELMKLLFEEVFKDPTAYIEELKQIPIPAGLKDT